MKHMKEVIMVIHKRLDSNVKAEKNVYAAPTNAARIGVLKQRRTSRHHRGYFFVRHHGTTPYGRSVRGIARCTGPFARYANLHGTAHPDWRRGERFEPTAAKEAVMATFARRARRAQSPRVTNKTCLAPTPAALDRYKTRPEFRVVHGLKSATHGFTVIGDQCDLMDMDAPETLPAGSCESFRPCPDAYPDWWAIQQTTTRRSAFR